MKLVNTRKPIVIVKKLEQPPLPPKKKVDLEIETINDYIFTVKGKTDPHWDNFVVMGGRFNTKSHRWLFDNELKQAVENYIKSGLVTPFKPSSNTVSSTRINEIYTKIAKSFEENTVYTSENILEKLGEIFGPVETEISKETSV